MHQYATPIPPLTDQSQWPEVDIEFSLCPPLTRRKADWPKQSRYKAWFEKGESSKKAKKDDKPKRPQKGKKKYMQALRGTWAPSWIYQMSLHS